MKKSELRLIIKEEIKKLNETIISKDDKKTLLKYIMEIIDNINKYFPEAAKTASFNKMRNSIITIINAMTHEKTHPDYNKFKKYMPKQYDKEKFFSSDLSGNIKNFIWWNLTDNQQFTLIKRALNKKGYKQNSLKEYAFAPKPYSDAPEEIKQKVKKINNILFKYGLDELDDDTDSSSNRVAPNVTSGESYKNLWNKIKKAQNDLKKIGIKSETDYYDEWIYLRILNLK